MSLKTLQLDFNEIKIFDDAVNDTDIMKTIISAQDQEDPFYTLDIADVVEKHKNWVRKMPKVMPHYAVKCNPDATVISVLAALGAGFDCASEQEIRHVMQFGVPAEKIIFANPTKSPSHIKFAKKVDVSKMSADSKIELFKIKDLFPEADIIIRIKCDATNLEVPLGSKFGCEPDDEAIELIRIAKELDLSLHGFCFHIGSRCGELSAYSRGIGICKKLITISRSIGFKDVQIIDIGGGIPGETAYGIDKLATLINNAIQDIDPSIKIISEPGRYYVTSAFSLVANLHTKKIISREDRIIRMYYMNCGVYNGFMKELLKLKSRVPVPLYNPVSDEKFASILWGPTLDFYDCILKDALLPEFQTGDWLVWKDMGAYSISIACNFNGFMPPKVYPFIRKSHWQALSSSIDLIKRPSGTCECIEKIDSGEYIEN